MYVLCHRRSRPTGRKLAAVFGLPARCRNPMLRDNIVIRWGTAQFPELSSVIQPAESVAKAGNKLVALRIMQEAGVPVPAFSRDGADLEGTILGRRTNGFGGQDIVVYEDGEVNLGPVGQHDFYTEYIPNRREYRIHVVGGEIVRVQRKYLDFPEQNNNPHVQNYAQGYRFRTPARTLNRDRLDAATGAVAALGLDFGAVDLLVGQDNNPYVLEVNTAPKLAPLTASQYARALVSLAADRGHALTIHDEAFAAFGGVNE